MLLVFSGINFKLVSAQTNTPSPTVTSTFEPIWKTPTPRATDFYDCPEPGEMENFGTETPSVRWMNYCSYCLGTQEVEGYTETPMPTMTGTPGTPMPTPTATATPTAIPGEDSGWMEIVFPVFGDGWEGHITFDDLIVDGGYDLGSNVTFIMDSDWGDWFLGSCWDKTGGFNIRADAGVPTAGKCSWQSSWTGVVGQGFGVQGSATYSGNWNHEGPLSLCYVHPGGVSQNCSIYNINYVVWTGMVISGGSGYGLPEPTPTVTATPGGGFCKDVGAGGVDGESAWNSAEGIFVFPVPYIGESDCRILMPEFEIPVTLLNLIPGVEFENDILFPGVIVCVRGLFLGDLVMLNLEIDLDFYAVIVGAMMILRKILRS